MPSSVRSVIQYFKKHSVKTVKFGSRKTEIRTCFNGRTIGHIQNFHCIKVFSGYTASSILMATCVTLIELTDWTVGNIQNFHCIKVFSGYTASSILMTTYVTLADLTDWSLFRISVKTAKFRSWGRQKSSKIFQILFLYSDDFPFIKAFFGNATLCTSMVYCAILSDLVRIKMVIQETFSQNSEIWIAES